MEAYCVVDKCGNTVHTTADKLVWKQEIDIAYYINNNT